MKRCVIQFNGGGGFANFAAERLEMMPESGRSDRGIRRGREDRRGV